MNHADIQGLIRYSYGTLRHADYWLLHVKPLAVQEAKSWIRQQLASGLVRSAARPRNGAGHAETLAMAFSHAGLEVLGMRSIDSAPFPTPFVSGQGSPLRASLLQDIGQDAWTWADIEGAAGKSAPRFIAHVLLVHLRDQATGGLVPPVDLFDAVSVTGDDRLFGDPILGTREAFGFRDGLSQPFLPLLHEESRPEVAKTRAAAGPLWDDRIVADGEFVLGHRNQYREIAYCPDATNAKGERLAVPFGHNGSYLAVRQIRQDVETFRTQCDIPAPPSAGCPFDDLLLSEKMIGRRKDGTPLAWAPTGPPEVNAFRYLENDVDGFQVPRGAHIRRANPRDVLGSDSTSGVASSKLHRLLRRGRPYIDRKDPATPQRGIMFVACNADLDRQYEFIQKRWLFDPRFDNSTSVLDPILGERRGPDGTHQFKMQGLPIGTHVSTLSNFTQTIGGGYFFMPGLRALRFIVEA